MSGGIDPFSVAVPADDRADLAARLERTRWPDLLHDTGWTYGTDREYLTDLCTYWREDYDWAAFESRLNAVDQFTTTVDGQRLHFYHARSPAPDATPLLLSHGWPGSVAEFVDVIEPLADPTAHGGNASDAFHVVAPSLPGYGFSGPTHERGYGCRRIAGAFATLMDRLGYESYVAQGGDWGALITAILANEYPDAIDAIHTNALFVKPSTISDAMDRLDEAGRADFEAMRSFRETEAGYQAIQGTKPHTLGYGLMDSPAGLAAWIVEKFHAWSDCDDTPEEAFDRDRLLDNLSVYWLTGTITSSMRLYRETHAAAAIPDRVAVPTGHARYPAEVHTTPRVWAEEVYNIVHWADQPEGGHFAAMEVPELFVEDLRSFARTTSG